MSLAPGTRLGPYEILGLIGAGGMGEVYRARDTKLGREVALKAMVTGVGMILILGTAAHMSPEQARGRVFLSDRHGAITDLKLPRGSYSYPRASPDGKRLVLETTDGKHAVVALYDLSGASSVRRLTFGGNNRLPIWSGDGRRVAFQSDREGDLAIFWQSVDGGAAERLTRPEPAPHTCRSHGCQEAT